MLVEQIWTGSPLRNYNYLVGCETTGEALAIDPLDFRLCLQRAKQRGLQIRKILNTHEHADHIGGNKGLQAATGATIIAHKNAGARIPNVDHGVGAGDVVRVGSVELDVLDTPGHTMAHICLLSRGSPPALFSGDTLFNAGAGNCHNGGHPEALFETFRKQIFELPDDTRLYPGHDYIKNNLEFSLSREPDNADASALLKRLVDHDPENAYVTTIGEERRINSFFRLSEPALLEQLETEFGQSFDERGAFLKLRELRNRW